MSLKPKPWWLRIFTAPYQWVTIFPHIYHPSTLDPNQFPALVEHEMVHLKQQSTCNRWSWLWAYLTQPDFRLQVEAPAIAAEVLASPAGYRESMIQRYAVQLAGEDYRIFWRPTVASPVIAEKAIRAAIAATHSEV
jgi:hypothetical protein